MARFVAIVSIVSANGIRMDSAIANAMNRENTSDMCKYLKVGAKGGVRKVKRMQKRKFDELISYFNRKVADMDIDINYKMELLGMVSALVCTHEKELNNPTTERTGKWTEVSCYGAPPTYVYSCSGCGSITFGMHNFCPNCGAKMQKPEDDIPMEYFESGGR